MAFHSRAVFDWSLRTRTLPLGRRTLIMGILNVTPDSFSDGGNFASRDAAVTHAREILESGADILDVGGESTRPNATPLSPGDEQARVLPVIEAILKQRPDTVISIDTYHAETARLAVQAGAEIVNDVSGHLWDSNMASTCAALGCGTILMHTRGRPSEWKTQPALAASDVVPLVLDELRLRAAGALKAGVAREKIVLDPGFGFGKIGGENYPLLAGFSELHVLGFPLLAGLSRKSFLRMQPSTAWRTDTAQEAQGSLLSATLAANTAAILAGAHIVRVHDVAEARASADVADAILSAASSS
jgi:dihydropteroate synthase